MGQFEIKFEEPAWPEAEGKIDFHITEGVQATMLVGGMKSGKSSVAFLLPMGEDSYGLMEMSLEHLEMLTAACRGREKHLKSLRGYDT